MPKVRQHQTTHARIQTDGDISMAQAGVQGLPSHMADRGVHQHGEEDANEGLAVHGRSDAPSPKRQTKRQTGAQGIQHRSPKETPVVAWPFLYSYKEGGCVVNTAPHKSAYAQAEEVGVALI